MVRMAAITSNPGQHLFVGVTGTELTPATRRLLQTVQPGGVVLFARNVDNADQLRAFVRALHEALPIRPLIAIDQENERVNRLRNIVGELPSLAEIKHAGTAEQFGSAVGSSLRDLGVDLDFAPVLDLELVDPQIDNALRGRCWGQTPTEVVAGAGAFITGLERAGIASCPKHFPGLGAALQDSHEKLPTITRSLDQLVGEDLRPFAELAPRLSALMVGHGHYVALDGIAPQPASLSRKVTGELLRQKLGFTGLVVTDDREMGAITRGGNFAAAVSEAIRAGADMVLVCHTADRILTAHEALVKMKIPAESGPRIERFRRKWISPKK